MCSHYHALIDHDACLRWFGIAPANTSQANVDMWPGGIGSFIRLQPRSADDDTDICGSHLEMISGVFGLIPEWTQDTAISRHTYNARSETASAQPSFRDAWSHARHCIIAASAIFEPDCRGSKTFGTRIVLTDSEPMGIAGLWSACKLQHKTIYSYTMLTVNADEHAFMNQFRAPTAEKRMVVVLPRNRYADWLKATPDESMAFMEADRSRSFQVSNSTTGGDE